MTNGSSWCGISHGAAGQMTNSLLLMAWPYQNQVLTSFRYTTVSHCLLVPEARTGASVECMSKLPVQQDYAKPSVYTGQANLTTLSSRVTNGAGNSSLFEIVYHCQNCLKWDQAGQSSNVSTSNGGSAIGRAAAKAGPSNAGCPSAIDFGFHDNGYGQFTAEFTNVTNANYASWAALPVKPVTTAAGCAAGNATR